jgi:hypothetical protein
LVIEKVNLFIDKLKAMRVDLAMIKMFATGSKGYHIEIPPELFVDKVPKNGTIGLPSIYREMALELCVDTLDLSIYSAGRGRMWRQPNVRRSNGRYKVALQPSEMAEMTVEMCHILTAEPRALIAPKAPELCLDLSILYSRCAQKVEDLMKKRAKFKPDPEARKKATCASVQWMMSGIGIKDGTGFQQLATQLGIVASTAGWDENRLVLECAGLISSHQGDGARYGSEAKREEEIRRMHRYMNGNLCYEFSIGALKSLMTHSAPDLDGQPATKEEIKENIEEAAKEASEENDEYGDVARGVSLNKMGVYADTEFGKKRICAISFDNASVLQSAETCQIVGYETDILVNGKRVGRQTLEVGVFSGLVPFNQFASRYGHAFQGTDVQVRMVMMRFVEKAKKKGGVLYVLKREGLDMVSIPEHDNPLFRKPFAVWADYHGVIMAPHVQGAGLELTFAGYPDPRGVFKTDITHAPELVEWVEEEGNREALTNTLRALMTCQRPELLGKLLGWYTACFWKQMFHRLYKKFPLLHVNGAAGLGKTEMNITIASLFYWQQEARPLTPGSTTFAMNEHLSASASIPLIIDEYKPQDMTRERHNQMRALLRDVYNQRDVAKGGGTRDSENYRSLQFTQLAAPLVFIAEAAEDEAAVMERVVLATVARPPAAIGLKWLSRFNTARDSKHHLGILGQYLAAKVVHQDTLESVKRQFDRLYDAAKQSYMVTEADLAGGISPQALEEKQNAKERSVYNHTVAKFGFQQFRKLVNKVLDGELDDVMAELEDGIYSRMSDLHAATTPEHVKVLKEMSTMSHHVDKERPEALRKGHEYAFSGAAGQETIEIAIRTAYFRYRTYCKNSTIMPLYGSYDAFSYSLRDSPAFIRFGNGEALDVPDVYVFDVNGLARLGVSAFKMN